VQFDRILDGFTGPFEKVTDWNVKLPAGHIDRAVSTTAYVLNRDSNNDFIAANRLAKAGLRLYTHALTNDIRVEARADVERIVETLARDLGVNVKATAVQQPGQPLQLQRIALWDQYGGSIESGWTRWILEQFEFPFTRVYPPELDAGDLNAKYDVLILPQGAVPAAPLTGLGQAGGGRGGRGGGAGPNPDEIPAEYRAQLGRVTADKTIPQIRAFIENGGTVVALSDSAMNLAGQLKLPIENHLTENGSPIPAAKYFVPGSVLTARVDTTHPLAAGMRARTDFFFDNNPVFKLGPGADAAGLKAFAWFDSPTPLHSGWAWGQQYLNGGVLAIEARVGNGRLVLYGPEILQRAQPHGTFKLLFNALYASATSSK
jgi:hypothetical protein